MKTLRTERLILEPLREGHARPLYRGLREKAVYKWIPVKRPGSLADLKTAFRNRIKGPTDGSKRIWLNWAIRLKSGGYAGRTEATIRPDGTTFLGYVLLKPSWGKGIAREATARMTEYLFSRKDVRQVEAAMDEANIASWKTAEGLGLIRTKAKKGDKRYEVWRKGLLARGLDLRAAKKFPESRTIMLWLARARPKDARAQYQCAWAHDLLGLEREAVPFYERAIALGLSGKDLEGAFLGLGSSLRRLGRVRRAAGVLGRGAEWFPKSRALRVFWAMALLDSGQRRKAMGIVLRELGETSADPGILRYRRAILGYAEEFIGPSSPIR